MSLTFQSQLLNTIEQAVVATDDGERIVFWNAFAERLYGWPADEVIGQSITSRIPARGFEEKAAEILSSVKRTGKSWSGELRAKKKDGSEFPVWIVLAPIGHSGERTGIMGVSYDITDRKQKESALLQTEARQRALLSAIPDRVFRISAQMQVLEYFGSQGLSRPVCDVIGKTIREVVPLNLVGATEDAIRTALSTRSPVRLDFELTIRDELRAYEGIYAPSGEDEVVAVLRDVTERKRDRETLDRLLVNLEQRVADRTRELERVNASLLLEIEQRRNAVDTLRASHTRLQLLVDRSPAAIVELDSEGRVLSWSRAAERMFGWSASEAIGRYNPAVPPERLPQSVALLSAFLDGGSVDSLPLERCTKDGHTLRVTMSTSAIRDPSGAIERLIIVYNRLEEDVTHRVNDLSRKMRDLTALSRTISGSVDLAEAMRVLQTHLASAFGIRSGVLLLATDGQLEQRYAWGNRPPAKVIDSFTTEDLSVVTTPTKDRPWLREALLDAGSHTGVLFLEMPAPDIETDMNLMRAVAHEIAAALNNARLFDAVRRGNDRLRELSRQLMAVQEDERRHIGRELHDQIGQIVTGLKFSLAAARAGGGRDGLAQAEELVADLFNRIRKLSLELRPPVLDDAGLVPALTWHVARYAEQTGIDVDFRQTGIGRLSPEIETAAFRIVQEAMTNAARHGHAARIMVRAWIAVDRLLVEVEDDGAGFSLSDMPLAHTVGLSGMRERAHLVGGTVALESTPGKGTRVAIDLPAIQLESESYDYSRYRG